MFLSALIFLGYSRRRAAYRQSSNCWCQTCSSWSGAGRTCHSRLGQSIDTDITLKHWRRQIRFMKLLIRWNYWNSSIVHFYEDFKACGRVESGEIFTCEECVISRSWRSLKPALKLKINSTLNPGRGRLWRELHHGPGTNQPVRSTSSLKKGWEEVTWLNQNDPKLEDCSLWTDSTVTTDTYLVSVKSKRDNSSVSVVPVKSLVKCCLALYYIVMYHYWLLIFQLCSSIQQTADLLRIVFPFRRQSLSLE